MRKLIFLISTIMLCILFVIDLTKLPKFDLLEYEIEDYIVQEGDTLWTIAADKKYEDDPMWDWIDAVMEKNNCSGCLRAGQHLKIYTKRK